MLKTTLTQLTETLPLLVNVSDNVEDVGSDNADETVERLPPYTKARIRVTSYPTPNAKVAFTQSKKVFTKALIFYHFDPKSHIWIKTGGFGNTIGRVLSQRTLDNLG